MTQKLILRNYQSPGDIVMLTAAVRDLHRCHPGRFITDVRTAAPDIWLHNHYISPLCEEDPDVRIVDCHYPLIHHSNQRPYHFIHGFIQYLNDILGTTVYPTEFKGFIPLSAEERYGPVAFPELADIDYWLVVSGGKYDFTAKWWSPERLQEVVDRFCGRINFVQVGATEHHHPPLRGVHDLRGRTTLRQLIQIMHHASGVICPVTLHMHLAAAVDTKLGVAPNRPCVVIAGGREPPHWEAYPFHQYIHTVGMLECCATGGCWRSRVRPVGDGDPKDDPSSLCLFPDGQLARCMSMITSEDVLGAMEMYLRGSFSSCQKRPTYASDVLS